MYKRIDKIENGVLVHGNDEDFTEPTARVYYKNLDDALAEILKEVRKKWASTDQINKDRYVEIRWG